MVMLLFGYSFVKGCVCCIGVCPYRGVWYSVIWVLGCFCYRGRISRRRFLGDVCLSCVVCGYVGFGDAVYEGV